MSQKRSKIVSTILFIVLISCITYLSFFTAKKTERTVIDQIELSGNKLLNESDYFSFTRLNGIPDYGAIGLSVIKDRFLKHPYVADADVEFDGINKIKIKLIEKSLAAILISEAEPMLITSNFQLLPIFENIKIVELPLISNAGLKKVKVLALAKCRSIIEAFKIIDSAKILGLNMYNSLTEVNLRNGGEVVLSFSGISAPVIFGRGGTARKMVYLSTIWKEIINKSDDTDKAAYIDLRFSDDVYIGYETKV